MTKKTPAETKTAPNHSENKLGITKKSKTRLAKNPGVNDRRRRKAVQLIAQGVPKEASLVQAGYSPYYAHSAGSKFLQRPLVQSLFTKEIERALTKKNKGFGAMIDSYVEALDAPIIVKSTTEGIACIARDPDTQEVLPDHRVRMEASDKLIALHGGVPKEVEIPPPPQPGMTIIIARDQAKVAVQQAGMEQAKAAKIEATGTVTAPGMPSVVIRKG